MRAFRGLLVAAAVAVLVAGTGSPALAAPVSGTTTISGTVADGTVAGPLAAVTVGFWTTRGTVAATTRTDSSGRFALSVPSADLGLVYAGSRPDAAHAVFTADSARFVRGAIGAAQPTGAPAALPAVSQAAAPAAIAGGASVVFRLQRAGRIAGSDPLLAGRATAATVERSDGSVVQTVAADGAGAFTSETLVPGSYTVLMSPKAPNLPATIAHVRVRAGATTTVVVPAFVRGATLSGRLTSAGAPVSVPITVFGPDGDVIAHATSDSTGAYAVRGLDTAVDSVVFGAHYSSAAAAPVVAPTVLPSRRILLPIDGARDDVTMDAALKPAAVVTGTATKLIGGAVAVVAELKNGTVVADTTAGASGRYTLSGLTPGVAVRLVALTGGGTQQRYGTLDLTPVAGAQDVPAIDASATTPVLLSGAASGVKKVAVRASASVFGAASVAKGRYAIEVVPGRYTVTVGATGRVDDVVTVAVDGITTRTLRPGPKAALPTLTLRPSAVAPAVTAATVADSAGLKGSFVRGAAGTLVPRGKLPGGTYRFVAGSLAPPASDGPWSYRTPTAALHLHGGKATSIVVRLSVVSG